MARFALRVNGVTRSIDLDDPDTPLLYVCSAMTSDCAGQSSGADSDNADRAPC